jgi:lactoylglutathione lyase
MEPSRVRPRARPEDIFHAVADPTRRAMLDLLREGDRSVTELAHPFRMTQPAISQHLAVLRRAGLVRARRSGRRRLYRMDTRPLERVYDWSGRYFSDPAGHVWGISSVGPRAIELGPRARPGGRLLPFPQRRREDPAITHARTVSICVRDQQRALEFFRDKLGFEVRRDEPMESGARWIELAPRGAETAIVPYVPPGSETRIGTFSNVVFGCADLEATRRELAARGVKFLERPGDQSSEDGLTRFADVDGNTFVLVEER